MQINKRDQYQAQAVKTASPPQLVLMLYDGALAAIVRARQAQDQPGALETINRELLRVQTIVSELSVTLDRDRGGTIAANLDALYDFCLDRLIEANLTKDLGLLEPVQGVLEDLRAAWDEACCAPVAAGVG